MIPQLQDLLREHRNEIYLLFRRYVQRNRALLLHSDLVDEFEDFCTTEAGAVLCKTPFAQLIRSTQEAVVRGPSCYLAVRVGVANWRYLQIHTDDMLCREVAVAEFLRFKEGLVDAGAANGQWIVEIDLRPFERGFPKLKEARSIGRGVEFLNRHLSGRLFDGNGSGHQRLFEFLNVHEVRGQQLMLNAIIRDVEALREALRYADVYLEGVDPGLVWTDLEYELKKMGFEPGWGRTGAQIRESMALLSDILEAPSPESLERFLRRIPMIFNIVILSPHGFFGQSGVLGKPDTGGQVVYILDQVRALEREIRRSIYDQGLDVEPQILVVTRLIPEADGTTCNQRIEPIVGTEHARILRVPFRDEAGDVVPQWISRFEIWPYLERFALDAGRELLAELDGRPDFVIGNYSDGNLVASMLSHRLRVTQCNIAHALEKTKYLHSDLYWKEHDAQHHFACQYTADLISMNTADFIITSTYQEIAGTRDSVGQYESYGSFSLPGLYRVNAGIDTFDPKFNIVAPGADAEVFFPFHQRERRLPELQETITQIVQGEPGDTSRGCLINNEKPLLFAMSRLDHIKNMSGLLEWYARSDDLREAANLLVVGGYIDPQRSSDDEEHHQIERMHHLFDEYGLDDCVRWVEMQPDKTLVGELYRHVADTRGAFVQPALFEAFGLTVIEAMSSGLPVFATRYGGPLESIEHGVSGFHIDPNHGDEAARGMVEFFQRCREDPSRWDRISHGAIERVTARYTWELYASRLLALSRIYGFWKFITNIEREETRRYLEMFYGLMYRPLAEKVHSSD